MLFSIMRRVPCPITQELELWLRVLCVFAVCFSSRRSMRKIFSSDAWSQDFLRQESRQYLNDILIGLAGSRTPRRRVSITVPASFAFPECVSRWLT